MKPRTKVMFVCRANINRSPTARHMFEELLSSRGLRDCFELYDAGTHNLDYGTEFNPRIAENFHHIVVMDKSVEKDVRGELPKDFAGKIHNFGIPDDFVTDQPELREILDVKLKDFLKRLEH